MRLSALGDSKPSSRSLYQTRQLQRHTVSNTLVWRTRPILLLLACLEDVCNSAGPDHPLELPHLRALRGKRDGGEATTSAQGRNGSVRGDEQRGEEEGGLETNPLE